jgi:2-dehydro-3-deoxyphosphogalactonate aldolase
MTFSDYLAQSRLIAILRGLPPDAAEAVGECLLAAGFGMLEVPLTAPTAIASLERLVARCGSRALVGAGTVVTRAQLADCAAIGARLIVAPSMDPDIIRAAKDLGMICLPGVMTPTEAYNALAAGADGLKLFPAEALPPAAVKALKTILPPGVPLLPVGGITPATILPYHAAGADGFGLGSALYRPGLSLEVLRSQADAFIQAAQRLWPLLKEIQP